MAQISIPMSNKVGYSMYWSSMWDNKISYSKNLKEDIYLRKIISFFFNDKFSVNLLKYKNNKYKNINIFKYNIHSNFNFVDKNFINFLYKINKIKMYSSKLWIIKYQKWVIIFYFTYLPFFGVNKKKINIFKTKEKLDHFFSFFSFYNKTSLKLKYSYNFFKKSKPVNIF